MAATDSTSAIRILPTRVADRIALAATVALLWINVATTSRWSNVPGALHGWRLPYYVALLAMVTVTAMRKPTTWWGGPAWMPRVVFLGGSVVLIASFLLAWLPPGEWSKIPFIDDWPPRFWSTVEGLRLLKRGTFGGWQWHALGGYSTASDITQSLTIVGALPMAIFGAPIGFHLVHLLLCLALPALVFVDIDRSETRAMSLTCAGFVALAACGLSWSMMRSGDTNSLAGLVSALTVLVASHRARRRVPFAFTLMVLALTLTAYSHIGFFAYAVGLLFLEALYYRDASQVHRAALATILAGVASLPQTYELLRYPAWFNFNNVLFHRPDPIDWMGVVRKIGYNVEILFLPARWFNDIGGMTNLFLPIIALAAFRREGRPGFYAWAALFAVLLMRFNVPEAGYLFVRPIHLMLVFTPVAIAWFILTRAWNSALAIAMAALFAVGMQMAWVTVPHQPSVEAFLPGLVSRVAASDGNLVLVENNPHRNVVDSATISSAPSLYGTHFEALLGDATGRRLYAGSWDGWQWTPYRGEMLAGGAWQGHLLGESDHGAFVAEMRKWGVRDLFVWSPDARRVIARWPEFIERSSDGDWRQFEFTPPNVDTRSVVTDHGSGELVSTDLSGGVVRLVDVQPNDAIVVRTHFHPAWEAYADGRALAVRNASGQLSFAAPKAGSYDVTLVYPKRQWLIALAMGTLLAVAIAEWRTSRR